MSKITVTPAETIIRRLAAHDVEYIFINSGTDYPPMIESMAKAMLEGRKTPALVTCPHENAAVGMAHGYYFVTGKAQAVMVHTNVGLANAVCGLINASCDNVPTMLFGGRTPILEYGHQGARNTPIGYGQEMRDQAALVRESVKWDYELRIPAQTADLVDRAYAIANSEPKGPVYLSLPREPLADEYETGPIDGASTLLPVCYAPDPKTVAEVSALLAQAEHPAIFAQRGAGSSRGFDLLSQLANQWGIPVVEYWATQTAISDNDPMAAGDNPEPWIKQADLIVVIDSLAPWMPSLTGPTENCPVVQIGPDPLFVKYPVRGFRADYNLAGNIDLCLETLLAALEPVRQACASRLAARHRIVAARNREARTKRHAIVQANGGERIGKPYLSYCLGQLAEKYDGKIVSELVTMKQFTGLTRPNSFYQEALSGGLGGCFPIALGMQLAKRDQLIIAAMGDGSYMFSNPVACHQIAEAMQLPVLIVVGNNASWGAVAGGVLSMYPDGYAAKLNAVPATALAPAPDFSRIASAANAQGERVTEAAELPGALERAVDFIRRERRAALVDVLIG